MLQKKDIILISDINDNYSLKAINIILKSKYFNIVSIITSTKNKYFKNKQLNNIKIYYDNYPHKNSKLIKSIRQKKILLCICTGFDNLIRKSFINLFEEGIYNIHPAYLPNNKGSHSTFYTVLNQNEIGASIHLMNEKLDSGPIVDRVKVKINSLDDAEKVFHKSRNLGLKLLKKNLSTIYYKNYKLIKNKKTIINLKKNISKFNFIVSNKKYTGEYIWNLIKAVNFKNNGFFIKHKNKKIKIIPKIIHK